MEVNSTMKNVTQEKKTFVKFVLFMLVLLISWNRILYSAFLSAVFKQITTLLLNALLLIGVLVVMQKSHHPFSDFGMRCDIMDICWGLILGSIFNFFLQGQLLPSDFSVYKLTLTTLCVLSEELIWRGYILCEINDITESKVCSILFMATGFSLIHLAGGINVMQLIIAFIGGLFWGYFRLYKNTSVFFSISMHFLINIV